MPTHSPPEATRGILFDLWNTLAFTDRTPDPIATIAAAFGLDVGPDWRKKMERVIMTRRFSGIGEALDEIAARTGHEIGGGWSRRDLILAWGDSSNRNRLFADALPALRRLRRPGGAAPRLRVGILSNTQSFDLDFMRRDGLWDLVDDVCLSCDCGLLKPDPRIYRHAAGRLGLPPERLLMVGDNLKDDVEGARSAGLQAALLDRAGLAAGSISSLAALTESLTC